MVLFIIASIVLIVYLSVRVIFNSFYKSENYYEYVKHEMDAKCNNEDYAFVLRKLGR